VYSVFINLLLHQVKYMSGNIKDCLTGIFQPFNSKFRDDEVREYEKCFDRHFLAIENLSNEEIYTKIK
jgi:hypothetical protein